VAVRSKRYIESKKRLDSNKEYTIKEAVELLKGFPPARFDQSVELSIKLGIDPKRSDQMVRDTFSLPKGVGKERKVIVITTGERVEKALKAGAIEAGSDELIKRLEGGWLDFDVAVATPDMMRQIGKLGRVLGPQGKMPSPKSGTVTEDVETAVKEFKAGKIEYRSDAGGNLHALVGKLSFSAEDLQENIQALMSHIVATKPPSAKGTFLQKVCLSSTVSPSIKLAI
jgi:large subunit ribosomal protein L1